MPVKVDDAILQAAVDAKAQHGTNTAAADALGIPRSTLNCRLKQAAIKNITSAASIVTVPVQNALERECTLLRDRLNVANTKLKQQHREDGLYDALCDEMHKIIVPLSPLPKAKVADKSKVEHVESLVMHISDEHADQIVEPHRVGGLETYNFGVALARAERFVDKTLSIVRTTLANYSFPELWILAYGDHVNGEIHDSTNHSEFRNAYDNSIACGQMHALMIRDLAPYFPVIKILYLAGNHGRRTKKKDYHNPRNNWDYLVARTAEMLCIDIPNAEFLIPDSNSYTFGINGWNFCAFHGDDIRSWNGIPHYGIERKTRRLTAVHSAQGRQIHYFVMGHFHSRSSIEHPSGEILMNGAWKATDEYAYENLGLTTKPSQLLHGVGKSYGVSFRFPVFLKFDGDTDGPQRYTAPLQTLGHLQKFPKNG